MKVKARVKCGILLILFLCLELAAFSVGGKAVYSTPVELSLAEGAPVADRDPILPQMVSAFRPFL